MAFSIEWHSYPNIIYWRIHLMPFILNALKAKKRCSIPQWLRPGTLEPDFRGSNVSLEQVVSPDVSGIYYHCPWTLLSLCTWCQSWTFYSSPLTYLVMIVALQYLICVCYHFDYSYNQCLPKVIWIYEGF